MRNLDADLLYTLKVLKLGFLSPGIMQDDPLGEEEKKSKPLFISIFLKKELELLEYLLYALTLVPVLSPYAVHVACVREGGREME